MISQINYEKGMSKTVATYLTPSSAQEAINALQNAILRCKYKITQQTPNMIQFKTPMTLTDFGYKMTATFNQSGRGTLVRIEGKYVFPISIDVMGICKKKIESLVAYL